MRRAAPTIALLAVLGAVFGFQAAAIGRTGFVWDELVMLREAVERTRPASRFGDGVTLAHGALSPLARGCRDAIATLGSARVLWLVFSMLLLGALALLAAALARAAGAERGGAAWSAVVAVTTLALTPMYQRWALQVRIDQPAIAAALLGGVALLYSRRVLLLALLAGVLMGIAVCCSARAGSVVALALLLANAERRMRSRCTTSDSDGASSARSLTPALALLALGAGVTVISVVALYSDGAAPW